MIYLIVFGQACWAELDLIAHNVLLDLLQSSEINVCVR